MPLGVAGPVDTDTESDSSSTCSSVTTSVWEDVPTTTSRFLALWKGRVIYTDRCVQFPYLRRFHTDTLHVEGKRPRWCSCWHFSGVGNLPSCRLSTTTRPKLSQREFIGLRINLHCTRLNTILMGPCIARMSDVGD